MKEQGQPSTNTSDVARQHSTDTGTGQRELGPLLQLDYLSICSSIPTQSRPRLRSLQSTGLAKQQAASFVSERP